MTAAGTVQATGLDLESVRSRVAADRSGRLRPVGLGHLLAGPSALVGLPALVRDLVPARGLRVAVLADATEITRQGRDVKDLVVHLLNAEHDAWLARIGPADGHVHADPATLEAAVDATQGAALVVAVGSGTICDVGKYVAEKLDVPCVAVQTAASVNGFADDQSVLLVNGVKRTVPTRWPAALVIDGTILAEAPAAMNAAGLGDLVSMFTATPDWYLANVLGFDDSYSATAARLGRDHGAELLELAPRLADNDPVATTRLAEILTVSGISMGVAGRTAPSSGIEHTISHLLEMAAAVTGRPTALHGAKVGVSTVIGALVWEHVMRSLDSGSVTLHSPTVPEMRDRVHDAFRGLDPTGTMGEECWRLYSTKLDRWRHGQDRVADFVASWPEHRSALAELTAAPSEIAAALRAANAPARFADLDPAENSETVHWAVANCHLMRDRFSVADLAFFLGVWDDGAVAEVLAEAERLGVGA